MLNRTLTLTGRSYLLIATLVAANLVVWIVAICLFAPGGRARILSLCAIAYTLGLRHALDADHISAIDNATRQLVAKGQRPLTCGLYFSLGHSTIVIAVTLAVAISASVASKLDPVSSVGGIIGISVSASFLFILALINSFILYKILRDRRRAKVRSPPISKRGITVADKQIWGCLGRIVRPLLKLIDRPWKLYPIGILFGFGFDTASEITLLGIAAVATRPGESRIAQSEIIILPALFTCGMSLVDSLDSTLMLWGYAMPQPGEENWRKIWRKKTTTADKFGAPADPTTLLQVATLDQSSPPKDVELQDPVDIIQPADAPASQAYNEKCLADDAIKPLETAAENDSPSDHSMKTHLNEQIQGRTVLYSDLSIVLTVISILVAFAISIIEFMGIAVEKCASCAEAAENSQGLDGRWWRFWQACNDSSGYIGAAIVGIMLLCGGIAIGLRRHRRKKQQQQVGDSGTDEDESKQAEHSA